MEKKLPNVFVNSSARSIRSNNKSLFYSKNCCESIKPPEECSKSQNILNEYKINKKINDIFSSSNFVYKAKVLITTKSKGTIKEVLVAKDNLAVLTIDGKKISYNDIIDIKTI